MGAGCLCFGVSIGYIINTRVKVVMADENKGVKKYIKTILVVIALGVFWVVLQSLTGVPMKM